MNERWWESEWSFKEDERDLDRSFKHTSNTITIIIFIVDDHHLHTELFYWKERREERERQKMIRAEMTRDRQLMQIIIPNDYDHHQTVVRERSLFFFLMSSSSTKNVKISLTVGQVSWYLVCGFLLQHRVRRECQRSDWKSCQNVPWFLHLNRSSVLVDSFLHEISFVRIKGNLWAMFTTEWISESDILITERIIGVEWLALFVLEGENKERFQW